MFGEDLLIKQRYTKMEIFLRIVSLNGCQLAAAACKCSVLDKIHEEMRCFCALRNSTIQFIDLTNDTFSHDLLHKTLITLRRVKISVARQIKSHWAIP
jgi:hypothetical protein